MQDRANLLDRVHSTVAADALARGSASERHTAEPSPEETVKAAAEPVTEVPAATSEPVAAEPVAAVAAEPETAPPVIATTAEIPMGVRGDVVVRWIRAFSEGERREMPDLLEKLRKDKKVRVPELQIICAEALGEPPQHRKKSEHLDVLRRHFAPSERGRMPVPSEAQIAAN